MAKYKNFDTRHSYKYQLRKEKNKNNNRVNYITKSLLNQKFEDAGLTSEHLKKEKDKIREDNPTLGREDLSHKLSEVDKSFKERREALRRSVETETKVIKDMLETTVQKHNIQSDYLNPGHALVGHKKNVKPIHGDNKELADFHKSLKDDFFGHITNAFDVMADDKQSTSTFFIKNLEDAKINHQNVKAKNAYQNPKSLIESYQNIYDKGKVVAYDLETIGGKTIDGVWKPLGITEYSFQTLDVNTGEITSTTAVMGISRKDYEELYAQITKVVNNGELDKNNDLWVTANRMMKYGHANTKFKTMEDGTVQVVSFVGEDEVSNVMDLEQIKRGFLEHVNVYENAKEINGMKDYDYNFFKQIAEVKKKGYTMMGYNDLFFDSPIIDSQMNKLYQSYVATNNTAAIDALKGMFTDENSNFDLSFNPAKNQRFDLRAAVSLTVDKKGYEPIFGKGYNEFLNEKALSSDMLLRQEYLVERHFSKEFQKDTAHLAVADVRNLLRLGFEKSEIFGSNEAKEQQTLLGSIMGVLKDEYGTEATTLAAPGKDYKQIVYAKRNSQSANYTGRGVLGFTVDNTNGAYKTAGGFMVGNASKAYGDVSHHNIKIGGHLEKDQFYSFGGIKKMTMSEEFINEANKHMPEYARREMYVVKLDKFVTGEAMNHEMAGASTYLFFNELAEAEGQLSSLVGNIGKFYENENATITYDKIINQVYGVDATYTKQLAYDKAIDIDKLKDPSSMTRRPATLKKGTGWKAPKNSVRSMKNAELKRFTFYPKIYGGDEMREGPLLRSKSNKDLKFVHDPYTNTYHEATIAKRITKDPETGKEHTSYMINASTRPYEKALPDDLETISKRNKSILINPRTEYVRSIDSEMKPLMSHNGKGYFMQVKDEQGQDKYVDYFEYDKYKRTGKGTLKYYSEEDFEGGLQRATKVYNPKDSRFTAKEEVISVTDEISGRLQLDDPHLTQDVADILNGVDISKKGRAYVRNMGLNAGQEVDEYTLTKAFYASTEMAGKRAISDRARRHATDNIYKRSKAYAKLLEALEQNKEELQVDTSSAKDVKAYLQRVADKLSDKVSRGKVLNGEDVDSLVVAALGYVPKGSETQQSYIYGSTLHNYIGANDIYHERHASMSNMFNYIAEQSGIQKGLTTAFNDFTDDESDQYITATNKFEAMYNYIVEKVATEHYSDPKELNRAINLRGNTANINVKQLKSYYEFNVTGLGQEDKYLQKTINSFNNEEILRVNLNSGDEYNLVDKAFKLYKGEFANKDIDGQVKKAQSMQRFIIDISKRNKELFENNVELQYLLDDVTKANDGGLISAPIMASRFINALKQEKEKMVDKYDAKGNVVGKVQNAAAGILRTDFSLADLAVNDEHIMKKVSLALEDINIIKEAYDNTSKYLNAFSDDAVIKMVDKYLMPTYDGKTGNDALKAIMGNGTLTHKQQTVFEQNWLKAREAHVKSVSDLSRMITQGGGQIFFDENGISVKVNGKVASFSGIPKTKYSNGTLYHQVNNSKVASHLVLGWDAKTNDFKLQSNLESVFKKSRTSFNLKQMSEAIESGEFNADMIQYFVGRVQGKALEEAVITDFNLHEQNAQFRIAMGSTIAEHLEELIGTEHAPGRWAKLETIDKDIVKRIRNIVTSDNWQKQRVKELTPELTELLIKNVTGLVGEMTNDSNVETIMEMTTFSLKDAQVARMIGHVGERYSQRRDDMYDNAQRPVSAAQKKVFEKAKLQEGLEKYIKATGGNKQAFVGNLIDNEITHNMKTIPGIAVGEMEQAVTVTKVNVGQIGLQAIIDNNFEKIMAENKTVGDLSEQAKLVQIKKMKQKLSVFEQEKIIDARLMDSIYEMGSNKQFISATKDYMSWVEDIGPNISNKDRDMLLRMGNVRPTISMKDGKISFTSQEGYLVDRGEAVLKYMGFGGTATTEHSKQFMGRFNYGVFEKKGGIKLSDEQVNKFLQENIGEIERLAATFDYGEENNYARAANEVLNKYFKTGFYVEDVRQKSYVKLMNEGVEKDMTNALYVGLGQLDSRISTYLENASYQNRSLSKFKNQTLTVGELETIFVKNFSKTAGQKAGFESGEELLKAIMNERYYDSVSLFDIVDQFKNASLITSQAVAKHNNSGMIFDNTVGSIFNIYKEKTGSSEKALERLRSELINKQIIDLKDDNGKPIDVSESLKIKDGRLVFNTNKSNLSNLTNIKDEDINVLDTVESLNINNLINLIEGDKDLREKLVHTDVKIYDPNAPGKLVSKKVYGDIITTEIKDGSGEVFKVAVGSKAPTATEMSIDGEYMTIYDHRTVQGLTQKAKVETEITDQQKLLMKLENDKKNLIAKGQDASHIDEKIASAKNKLDILKNARSDIAEELGNLTDISKGKKVGSQEFNIYGLSVINESTTRAVEEYMKGNEGIDDAVLNSLKDSFSGVLIEKPDGTYEMAEEYKNYKVLDSYMKNIKRRNLFKSTGAGNDLELELREDMLELDEYKHLKNIYKKIRNVADEHIGPDAAISVRYAEDAYKAESAHFAHLYNSGTLSDNALIKHGFEKKNIGEVIVSGSEAEQLKLDSIFTKNYIVDLGDEFGQIAVPKAGKVAGDSDIKTSFQSTLIGIQRSIKEYADLHANEESQEAINARDHIRNSIENFKENLRKATYDKEGMFYNASKTELEESFRVKSSSASTFDTGITGAKSEELEIALGMIDSKEDKDILEKAMINGRKISELESNGIYHDYMFVSRDVFENLGYFDHDKLQKHFNVTKEEIENNYEEYANKMTNLLESHGDIFMGERYPAIWLGSDKPMRVFLDNRDGATNRARLSVATMLSMNGDNDGDSISASLIRSEKGVSFLEYKIARDAQMAKMSEGGVEVATAELDKAMYQKFGEDHKFFKAVEFKMTAEAITNNQTFANKGRKDMLEELQTAVANADANSIKAIKFNSLYGGMLYENYGGTSSIEALRKNESAVNDMIDLANKLNQASGGHLKMGSERIADSADYTQHLNDTFKIFDIMQNSDAYTNELSAQQIQEIKSIRGNITDEQINKMRNDAIMRARWSDYQSETMAKGRKGSIGPINVALQQHRQVAGEIYGSADPADYARKLAVQHISKEIEQEVISSKHGNVIFNTTKTTDLVDIYRKMWNGGAGERVDISNGNGGTMITTAGAALEGWIDNNITDSKIKSILTEIEASTGSSFTREHFGASVKDITDDNIGMVRKKLTNNYIGSLDDLQSSDYGRAVRKVSRLGGNMVDGSNVKAIDRTSNTLDMMNDIITQGQHKLTAPSKVSNSHGVVNMASVGTERAVATMATLADVASDVKIKGMSGLAIGALGFAAGALISGFAGGPVDQTSASDYAQQEENKPQAVSVPTMMDQGGFATTSGGSGYIINVRATTNKDMKNTKKVLRQAASASVGGGVNVNMNIKERSERFTERDFEQMIAGIF